MEETEAIDLHLLRKCGESFSVWGRRAMSPDEILEEREDADLADLEAERLRLARAEVLRKFVENLFVQGRNPARVMRNLYAFVSVLFPDVLEPLRNWEVAEILFSDTRAAQSARVKLVQKLINGGAGMSKAAWRCRVRRSRRSVEAAKMNATINQPWRRKKKSAKVKRKKPKNNDPLQLKFHI